MIPGGHVQRHRTLGWRSLGRWRTAAVALGIALTTPAAVPAQSGPAAPPDLARVRELAHAMVAERARVRRDQEEAVRPTREALVALRDALQGYLAECDGGSDRPDVGDAAARRARRSARRQSVRDALQRLHLQRESAAASWQLRRPVDDGADDVSPATDASVRLEVVASLEAETTEIVATPSEKVDDPLIARMRVLVERLQVSPPPRPAFAAQPGFILSDDTGAPPLPGTR